MSAALRKCVALGPIGTIEPGNIHDYRHAGPRYFAGTNTPWVRIWAHWPTLERTNGVYDEEWWEQLDAQVYATNQQGRYAIITIYEFPTWATGSTPGHDQFSKPPTWKPPTDVTRYSPYGRLLERLITRYSSNNPNRRAVAYVIEVCNEPNLQWFPQLTTGGSPFAAPITAKMIATASQIKAAYGWQGGLPLIAGPGTSDRRSPYDTPNARDWSEPLGFTNLVLNELAEYRFRASSDPHWFDMQPYFVWTHHNYVDIRQNLSGNSMGSYLVRGQINDRSWYRGWGNPNGGAAKLWLTEGGALPPYDGGETGQGNLLIANYQRLKADSGAGIGMEMLTQYLFNTAASYDSGLRTLTPAPDGTAL